MGASTSVVVVRSNGNGNSIWKRAAIKRIFIEFTSCPSSPLLSSPHSTSVLLLSLFHVPIEWEGGRKELLHYTHFGGFGRREAGERFPKRSEQAVTLCKVNRFPLLVLPPLRSPYAFDNPIPPPLQTSPFGDKEVGRQACTPKVR